MSDKKIKYINHSGGCPGADMMWEIEGRKYGIKTIAYSFYNHVHESSNQLILSQDELTEGFENVKIAAKSLKRDISNIIYPYIKNLISRNWFQVKNSSSIFAIGTFSNNNHRVVNGGTGWAVQMAVDNDKNIFFFEQDLNTWFKYDRQQKKFIKIHEIPTLTSNFAGIGTRNLNVQGINAIKKLLEYNFKGETCNESRWQEYSIILKDLISKHNKYEN